MTLTLDNIVLCGVVAAIIVAIYAFITRKVNTPEEVKIEQAKLRQGADISDLLREGFERLLLNRWHCAFELEPSLYLGETQSEHPTHILDWNRLPHVNDDHYYFHLSVPEKDMEMVIFPVGYLKEQSYIYVSRRRRGGNVITFGTNFKAPENPEERGDGYQDYPLINPDVVGAVIEMDQLLYRIGLPTLDL